MIVYKVRIGTNEFKMSDGSTAMSFAEIAKKYMVVDDVYASLHKVSIEILDEPGVVPDPEEDEEDDDESDEV